VPVSRLPVGTFTAELLVEFVVDPPPVIVTSALLASASAPELVACRMRIASPSPERATPATDRTVTDVRPLAAPGMNVVLTRRVIVTSMYPLSPVAMPLVGGDAVVIVVSASAV